MTAVGAAAVALVAPAVGLAATIGVGAAVEATNGLTVEDNFVCCIRLGGRPRRGRFTSCCASSTTSPPAVNLPSKSAVKGTVPRKNV
jgi:hypothetical protein